MRSLTLQELEAAGDQMGRELPSGSVLLFEGELGAGKTTLAILVAHARDAVDDSTAFVDLSTVDGDDMVADALAAAVGYISPGGDFLSGLLEVLSNGETLIVFDNCEHVIAAVATLCLQIVEGTSNVSFLNTSREALRIEEEFVYLLRPLATPPDTGRLTATQAIAWPAIQLFMERAREGGARGTLSDDEAPTVAGLCRRLDGNPHAIGPLSPGERVVDIGSGAGTDLLLAARRVGPTGRAIGIDMTAEMRERARDGARRCGLAHVEVLDGDATRLPLDDASVDVVMSNGVLNLVPEKDRAFAEIARVLRPGGRLQIADIVTGVELSDAIRRDVELWTG